MDPRDFQNSPAGRVLQATEGYWAFIPNPLPPPLSFFNGETVQLLSEADRALGRLTGAGGRLPNPHLLIHTYLRREAVLSSRIEGTQASLSDLFQFEAAEEEPPPSPDVLEVGNYVRAMEYGLERLPSLPLSLRLVRELHEKLMTGVRGKDQTPGEFRRSQNWIGPPGCGLKDSTFVPPPVPDLMEALGLWEKFLHEEGLLPPLVQCALLHYQFEAIHPFLDGNGRVGRLLITLFLCEKKVLPLPLLYLSGFFDRHRDEYYRRLLEISRSGDWIGWIRFFLQAVASQASDAGERSARIMDLRERYRNLLFEKRAPRSTLAVLDHLFRYPFVTAKRAARLLDQTVPTAQAAIDRLMEADILIEITGYRRNRVYCAHQLLKLFEEELDRGSSSQ